MDGVSGIHGRIAAIESRFGTARSAPMPLGASSPTGTPSSATLSGTTPSVPAAPTAFDAALSQALGSCTCGCRLSSPHAPGLVPAGLGDALTPALQLAPGQYGRLEPPAELIAFGNGKIPAAALVSIGHGDHRLHAPAARAFQQMEAAARAEGITFGISTSYRDFATQQRMAAEKGLYSQGGLAAAPGTSNHGWGLSVDLRLDDRAQTWMRENGWRFGFVEDVPREPWHWTYRPAS